MIETHDLGMKGTDTVFEHVTLEVPDGGALAIIGAEGSGKTALMLALTGRMKFDSGSAQVAGLDVATQARRVRGVAALGPVKDITDLDDNLTVEQHVAERIIMFNPWYKPFASRAHVERTMSRLRELSSRVTTLIERDTAAAAPSTAAAPSAAATPAAAAAQPTDTAPQPPRASAFGAKTYVSDLGDLDRFLLGLSLALIGGPQVVAVDDIDLLRRRGDRLKAWLYVLAGPQILGDALGSGPVPIVTCEDASEMAEAVATVRRLGLQVPPLAQIRLPTDPGHGLAVQSTSQPTDQDA